MPLLHLRGKGKKMYKVKNILALAFMVAYGVATGQSGAVLRGTVVDQKTKEPLPFATINIKGSSIGTISNASGAFVFQSPTANGVLRFSFIGYDSYEIDIASIPESGVQIELEPVFIELESLVVRPLTAEEFLRRVVRRFGENYADDPFQTKAYYREKFFENQTPIQYSEGFFKTYYTNFQTDSTLHQLLLYREEEDLRDLAFMARKREKKMEKERRKAEKNGEEYDEQPSDNDMIKVAFGGPKEVISDDPVIEREDFLDTLNFKKYRYEYGENTVFGDKNLITILFKTKGKVDHVKMGGTILVDEASNAIVSVEFDGKFVIPAWARPILFAAGFAIHEPIFKKRVQYQEIDTKWYPQGMIMQVNMGITKRYMFKSNDRSDFDIEQVFNIQEIEVANPIVIAEEKRFDVEEDIEEQIKPEEGIGWKDVNVLQIERDFLENAKR